MEALRIIKKPVNRQVTIDIPETFGEGDVEIIVLPVAAKNGKKSSKKFDPEIFRGKIKSDLSVEEIGIECQKLRDEWKRDI